MTPDFQKLLDAHDWDFMSAEGTRHGQGLASQKKLLYLCQQQPELFRLYNRAESRHIAGLCATNKFQTSSGNSAENENHNTQTHYPMNPEILRIIRAAALAVVNECDVLSNAPAPPGGADGVERNLITEKPAEPPLAEQQKAAKPTKAAKPAPAPAPEPEPEAEPMTEGRFKETVKTLSNEGKVALKAYFVKKFGHNTMAEVLPQNRADIHAKALDLGATDTDPDAIGDM